MYTTVPIYNNYRLNNGLLGERWMTGNTELKLNSYYALDTCPRSEYAPPGAQQTLLESDSQRLPRNNAK